MDRRNLHSFAMGAVPTGAFIIGLEFLGPGWGSWIGLPLMLATAILCYRSVPASRQGIAAAGVLSAIGLGLVIVGIGGLVEAVTHHGPGLVHHEQDSRWESEARFKRSTGVNSALLVLFGLGAFCLGVMTVRARRE